MSIGKKIRYQRIEAGFSQWKLGAEAFKLGKWPAQARIKNFELGNGRNPTKKELEQICRVLGITTDDLENSPEYKIPQNPKFCNGICIPNELLEDRPEARSFIEMLIPAMETGDRKLIIEILRSAIRVLEEKISREQYDNNNQRTDVSDHLRGFTNKR